MRHRLQMGERPVLRVQQTRRPLSMAKIFVTPGRPDHEESALPSAQRKKDPVKSVRPRPTAGGVAGADRAWVSPVVVKKFGFCLSKPFGASAFSRKTR